jgi:CheY-like chemotaxis protein
MPDTYADRPIEVLLVEDDPGDVLVTREALEGHRVRSNLHVVSNGELAMAYLRREGEHAGAPTPDLVLLDLNLPRMGGREVLRELKDDAELRRIPVVVMTTSDAEEDVLASYDLHANAYVRKPLEYQAYVAAVRAVDDFFGDLVRLPAR